MSRRLLEGKPLIFRADEYLVMTSDRSRRTDAKRISGLRRAFEAAENRGNASVQIAHRDPDDFIRMPPNAPPMGATAANERLAALYAEHDLSVTWNSDGVFVSGDLAIDSGTFKITISDGTGDAPTTRRGSWLLAYRRNSADEWKVIRDIYNWNE